MADWLPGRRTVLGGIGASALAKGAYVAAAVGHLDAGAALAGAAIDAALAAFPPREAQRRALTALRDAGTPGALHLADGQRWYALQLQRPLGRVDADWAARRLTVELARLRARTLPLFAAIGATKGTTGERYGRLWADPAGWFADSAEGRDAAVAAMNRHLARRKARVAALLGPVPAAALDVAVRRLSDAEVAAGKGGYRVLPTATTPGAYVVDLADIRRRPAWTLPSVVAHELIPGHMPQLAIEAATPPSRERMDYASAFVEGWAIHAETLAAADGAFAEPRAMLGHLHWLIFRVGRALADLGVHRHGWTLAQARARLVEWQGEPAYFAPFDADLARIAVEPGLRAGEALAWLGIADRARRHRDRVAFHRAVLAGGRKRLEQLP